MGRLGDVAWGEAVVSVVAGSAPAKPTPRAVANAKLARAKVSASLFLIPERPPTTGSTKLPAQQGVRNGMRHPPTRP